MGGTVYVVANGRTIRLNDARVFNPGSKFTVHPEGEFPGLPGVRDVRMGGDIQDLIERKFIVTETELVNGAKTRNKEQLQRQAKDARAKANAAIAEADAKEKAAADAEGAAAPPPPAPAPQTKPPAKPPTETKTSTPKGGKKDKPAAEKPPAEGGADPSFEETPSEVAPAGGSK